MIRRVWFIKRSPTCRIPIQNLEDLAWLSLTRPSLSVCGMRDNVNPAAGCILRTPQTTISGDVSWTAGLLTCSRGGHHLLGCSWWVELHLSPVPCQAVDALSQEMPQRTLQRRNVAGYANVHCHQTLTAR